MCAHPFAPPRDDFGVQHLAVDVQLEGAIEPLSAGAEQLAVRIVGVDVEVECDLDMDCTRCPFRCRRGVAGDVL